MITRIISGAQTGSDRAGLDAALHIGIDVGGWIPLGRRTDEGPLSIEDFIRYKLREHPLPAYPPRTLQNVLDSDGTVLFGNMNSPGCRLTLRYLREHGCPSLINPTAVALCRWIDYSGMHTLNVAGNRERTNPGIYQITFDTIVEALQ